MHLLHKWSKWEQYTEEFYRYPRLKDGSLGEPIPYLEHRQRRTCKICGKVQEEKI